MAWTRSHERLVEAYAALFIASERRRAAGPRPLGDWLRRLCGKDYAADLTKGEARMARRKLNAWRAGLEGRTQFVPMTPAALAIALVRAKRRRLRAIAKGWL